MVIPERYALKITIRKPFLNDFLEDSLLTEINPLTHKLVGDFIFKWYKAETMFHLLLHSSLNKCSTYQKRVLRLSQNPAGTF